MSDIRIIVNYVCKDFSSIDPGRSLLALARDFLIGKVREPKRVLDRIRFKANKGETIGIIGRNGSGKSTLLRTIAGIYAPTKGTVRINGAVTYLSGFSQGVQRRLTSRENIRLVGALMGIPSAQVEALMDDILDFAGMKAVADERLGTLSDGMSSRLSFSMSIHLMDRAAPDVLLLDEVFSSGGDETFRRRGLSKMEDLIKRGATILFASHSLGLVKKYCSRVIWIDQGRVIKDGDPAEVIAAYLESVQNPSKVLIPPAEAVTYLELADIYQKVGRIVSRASRIPAKVAGVTMVKDEGDIIYHTLEHAHQKLGISHFAIVDNGSKDSTLSEIERFAADNPVSVIVVSDDERAYWQWKRMSAIAEVAFRLWSPAWMYPFDADEALQIPPGKPFVTFLNEHAGDARLLIVDRRNYLPTVRDGYEPNPLKRMAYRTAPDPLLKPKAIVRWLTEETIIQQGNHAASDQMGIPLAFVKVDDALIRHYPLRSFEQLKSKAINGGLASLASMALGSGPVDHWDNWYKECVNDPEAFERRWRNHMLVTSDEAFTKLEYDPYERSNP